MTDDALDRAAKAAFKVDGGLWSHLSETGKREYRREIAAALRVMADEILLADSSPDRAWLNRASVEDIIDRYVGEQP